MEGLETDTTRKMAFRPLYHTAIMMKAITDVIFPCAGSRAVVGKCPPLWHPHLLYRIRSVLSLVDQYEAPYPENLRHITIRLWSPTAICPVLLPAMDGTTDRGCGHPGGGRGAYPSAASPQPPLAEREMAWRLIRQLSLTICRWPIWITVPVVRRCAIS